MDSPLQNDKSGPGAALNEEADYYPWAAQFTQHVQTHAHQDGPLINVNHVEEIQSTQQLPKEEPHLPNDQFDSFDKQKTEENPNQKEQNNQCSKQIQPKCQQKIHPQIKIEQTAFTETNEQPQEFKVLVHEVQSCESLSEDDENRHIINFTKSQINIPLEYMGSQQEDRKQNQQKLAELETRKSEQNQADDFYVKLLEDKWAKRQQENTGINILIQGLQTVYRQSQTTQNSVARSQDVDKQKPLNLTKKTQFKVKKVIDPLSSSVTNMRAFNKSSQLQTLKPFENHSEVTNSKSKQMKTHKYNRDGKKHLSNLESIEKSVSRHQFRKKPEQTVQYEMSFSNTVEMMSHILEDRCYNKTMRLKKNNFISAENQSNEQQVNKVRKIIKRSPYGILEIEVKDKKNSAKITNLRILKPTEMIRLKKIPNLVKGNKENFDQRTASKALTKNSDFLNENQNFLGSNHLPLLPNSNRK